MLLDLNRLVSLLYFLVDFSRIPYIQDKFLSRLKSQLELFNSGCYFDIAFSILTNWKHEFLSFMSSYEDYLKRTYNSRDLIPQKFPDILKLFRSIVDCFPGESYRFIQSVIEDYFWQILEKNLSQENPNILAKTIPEFIFSFYWYPTLPFPYLKSSY